MPPKMRYARAAVELRAAAGTQPPYAASRDVFSRFQRRRLA